MRAQAICERCEKPFWYQGKKRRRVCTPCKKKVKKAAQARIYQKLKILPTETRLAAKPGLDGVSKMSQQQVAAILKMSPQQVQKVERWALVKLRGNRDLMKQWLLYKEEG